jgi:hypothetical protein
MSKPGRMLHRGSAEVRGRKAMAEARMAVRDSAKAAAHAAAGLAQAARDELADNSSAERAGELAQRKADEAMHRVGEWLASPPIGERLGIVPRRRAWGAMAGGMALGVAAGAAVVVMLQRRARRPQPGMDASWEEEQRIAPPLGYGQVDLTERRPPASVTTT